MARDLCEWLERLGLGEYVEAFAANKIDAGVLPSLTNDDLKDLGVAAVGDRRKLLIAIANLTSGVQETAGVSMATALQNELPVKYTPAHLAERILGAAG
ncbi:MAG: SAM domain-containing protein [Hyphomicrobiaceae bacterium]